MLRLSCLLVIVACSSPPRTRETTPPPAGCTATTLVAEAETACSDGKLRRCLRRIAALEPACRSQRLDELARAAAKELEVPSTPPSDTDRAESRALHAAGVALVLDDQPAQAIAKLEAAAQKSPHPNVLADLGRAYAGANRDRDARLAYARAAALAETLAGKPLEPRPRAAPTDRYEALAAHPTLKLVAASAGIHVALWDVARKQVLRYLLHAADVRALAFTADGSLVVASHDGQVRVWDVHRGDYRLALTHAAGELGPDDDRAVALDEAGTRVAFGSKLGFAVYDVATGKQVLAKESPATALALSRGLVLAWSDGQSCSNANCTLDVLRADGTVVRTFTGEDQIEDAAVSPSGTRIALDTGGDTIVRELATGRQVRKLADASDLVLWLGEDELIAGTDIVSVKSGKPVRELAVSTCSGVVQVPWARAIACIEYDPSNTSSVRSFELVPLDGGKPAIEIGWTNRHQWRRHQGFSPDGRMLGIARERGVLLVDLETWTAATLEVPRAHSIDFDSVGGIAIAGYTQASLWSTKPVAKRWESTLAKFPGAVAVAPDSGLVAVANDGTIVMLDGKTGERRSEVSLRTFGIFRLGFVAGDSRVFAMDIPNGASIVDPKDASVHVRWREAIQPFNAIPGSKGDLLVTSSQFAFVDVRRAGDNERRELTEFARTQNWALGLALDKDEAIVATSAGDGIVRLHPIDKLETMTALDGTCPPPRCALAFHPNKRWLLAGNEGPLLAIYDVALRKRIAELVAGPDAASWALVAPTGVAGPSHSLVYFTAGDFDLPGDVDWSTWEVPASMIVK